MFTDNAPAPQDSCLVLLSGGLDSAVALALAVRNSKSVYAITFDYGQKHKREIESAKVLTKAYRPSGVVHYIVYDISLRQFKGLRDSDSTEPTFPQLLPQTWKPGRNIMFLAYAGAFCVEHSIHLIAVGIHAGDQPGYPDCTVNFLGQMEHALHLGLAHPLEIWAPLLHYKKHQIVALGKTLEVPFELTWSCYEGGEEPCGKCDACIRRTDAFKVNNATDPLLKEAK